jgi:hypothetical protein
MPITPLTCRWRNESMSGSSDDQAGYPLLSITPSPAVSNRHEPASYLLLTMEDNLWV